ncbi:MAG: DUF302 domain-containing protein [Burkholderiales bacterium]|nr:DUF302 domain-containing protein [Burkholderiales bacterium]
MLLWIVSISTFAADAGIVSKPSPYSVGETMNRLETVLKEKGITIFAKIDHAGEAAKAGLKMRPAQLLIFGNPKAGTPIMNAVPLTAIDLPLKALAWEDGEGKVWLSYNDPIYLQERFTLPDGLMKPIMGIGALMGAALK